MVQPATNDFCRAVLAFQILEGEIDGTAMTGVTFVLVLDTPPLMSEGNWRVGVVVNEGCTDQQMTQLQVLLSGKIGGPPEMLAGLISEMLGMERHPITISEEENGFHVQIGEASEYSASLAINPFTETPSKLVGMAHPAGDELTLANVDRSSISLMGVKFGGQNLSGFRTDFAWAA